MSISRYYGYLINTYIGYNITGLMVVFHVCPDKKAASHSETSVRVSANCRRQ